MELFATILTATGIAGLKVAVESAMETYLRSKKEKPLTILEREAVSEAAAVAVAKLIQPATLADVEKYDPKVRRITDNLDAFLITRSSFRKSHTKGRVSTSRGRAGKATKPYTGRHPANARVTGKAGKRAATKTARTAKARKK